MEVRQMASGPRQGAKRPVVAPTSARTASAAAATRHAPADPPAKAPEPISRGDGARQRVLQAALEVLDEDGLPGFTMEAVARRAGASKATVYRRWPTVGALLIDAMDATFQPFPVPDTGSVQTDVAHLLTAFVTLLDHTPFPRLPAADVNRCLPSWPVPASAVNSPATWTWRSSPTSSPARSSTAASSPTGPSPESSCMTSSRTYCPPGRHKAGMTIPRNSPRPPTDQPSQPAALVAGRHDDSRPTPPGGSGGQRELERRRVRPSDLVDPMLNRLRIQQKPTTSRRGDRSSGNCGRPLQGPGWAVLRRQVHLAQFSSRASRVPMVRSSSGRCRSDPDAPSPTPLRASPDLPARQCAGEARAAR